MGHYGGQEAIQVRVPKVRQEWAATEAAKRSAELSDAGLSDAELGDAGFALNAAIACVNAPWKTSPAPECPPRRPTAPRSRRVRRLRPT